MKKFIPLFGLMMAICHPTMSSWAKCAAVSRQEGKDCAQSGGEVCGWGYVEANSCIGGSYPPGEDGCCFKCCTPAIACTATSVTKGSVHYGIETGEDDRGFYGTATQDYSYTTECACPLTITD